MNKIKELLHNHRELVAYLIVGILTTVVSLAVYYLCVFTFLNPNDALELQIANVVSWFCAVIFAYFTNRKFVFQSKNSNLFKEGTKFCLSRIVTLIIDMFSMFLFVTLWQMNDKIAKLIVQVIVTIGNYMISKFFVFTNKKRKREFKFNFIKNCVLIFLVSGILGTVLLCLSYALPNETIYNNAKSSSQIFADEGMYKQLIPSYENTQLDNYTDALIMGEVVYNGDESIVEKAMKVYRYTNDDPVNDFIGIMNNEKYSSSSYERYWHGNIAFIRPAFLLFDYASLRIINIVLQFLLVICVVYLMAKKGLNKYIFPFVISLLVIMPFTIGFSFQFSSVYYVTLITSIIVLKYNDWLKQKGRYLYLFFIDGILINYLDLLTFPVLSLGIPLIFYMLLNNHKLKESIFDIIKISVMWGLGYFGMWVLKWSIGSLLCGENFFGLALDTAKYRMEADAGRFVTIIKNIMVYYKKVYLCMAILIFIYYVIIFIKNQRKFNKNMIEFIPYLIIIFIPFAWYFVLSQHSNMHYWFTNKSLMISFFAFLVILTKLSNKIND